MTQLMVTPLSGAVRPGLVNAGIGEAMQQHGPISRCHPIHLDGDLFSDLWFCGYVGKHGSRGEIKGDGRTELRLLSEFYRVGNHSAWGLACRGANTDIFVGSSSEGVCPEIGP